MSDEAVRAVELEIGIAKYFFMVSVKLAEWTIKAIKALHDMKVEGKITEKGEKHLNQIWEYCSKYCGGEEPVYLNMPENIYKDVIKLAKKNNKFGEHGGIMWAKMADLNASDGFCQIAVPPNMAKVFTSIINRLVEEQVDNATKQLKEYEKKIAELQNDRFIEMDPEKQKQLDIEIENLECARDEVKKYIDGDKSILEKDCTMSMEDYLATGLNTEFEIDPDKAISEYEKGVDIAPKDTFRNCVKPVRDPHNIPSTSTHFYLPDTGVDVKRDYKIDDKTGLVYSEYSFTDKDGVKREFTDKGITSKEWEETLLPEMAEKVGCLIDTPTRVFTTEDRLAAYCKYFGKVTPKSERGENKDFSNADVAEAYKNARSEMSKGAASASIRNSDNIEISVPPDNIVMEHGRLVVNMPDGNKCAFLETKDANFDEFSGLSTFTVSKNSIASFRSYNNNAESKYSIPAQDAKLKIDESFGRVVSAAKYAGNVIRHNSR